MAGRGPLPDPNRRRRNAPTIPTTALPASGRKGPAPRLPRGVQLGEAGAAWWRWAWRTPHAAAWSVGDVHTVARRAALEDALAALDDGVGRFDLAELLGLDEDDERVRLLAQLVGELRKLATGRLAVEREMRELDDRLGLSPKAFAALRWRIVDDSPQDATDGTGDGSASRSQVPSLTDRRQRVLDAS